MSKDIEVLVLDDEPVVGERLQDYLQKKGMSVEVFTASQQALDRLEEKTFHVVITDIRMAKPDGIDVMTAVKRRSPSSEVILITGYGSFETIRAAEAVGAFAYLHKPFKMDELYSKVVKAASKAGKHLK